MSGSFRKEEAALDTLADIPRQRARIAAFTSLWEETNCLLAEVTRDDYCVISVIRYG